MQERTPEVAKPTATRSEAVKNWQDKPVIANAEAVQKAVQKTVAKPSAKAPKAPFNRYGTAVINASATQLVATALFGADSVADRACHRGPKEGYPVRVAIDSSKKCAVIPAGEFARIRTGLMVDQPIENWAQSSCLDSQAAVSKVAVEQGEVVAYVTGVGQAVTIYEGSWLVLVRLGAGK